MKKTLKPRKTPQQARSKRTREEILQATAHLLNRKAYGDVSTNHIAKKTGISIGTLYKYYPHKDAILADLSLMLMQKDAELFGRIFEEFSSSGRQRTALVSELTEALMKIHRDDAQMRGVVYQNLDRLGLLESAQTARRRIQEKGTASVAALDPIRMWIAVSAINSAVHSASQVRSELQPWGFVSILVRNILEHLLNA